MLTENILIAKLNQPASRRGSGNLSEEAVAAAWTEMLCGFYRFSNLRSGLSLTPCESSFSLATLLTFWSWKTDTDTQQFTPELLQIRSENWFNLED